MKEEKLKISKTFKILIRVRLMSECKKENFGASYPIFALLVDALVEQAFYFLVVSTLSGI